MTDEPALLPAPRRPGRYRLALVCLGNICRSAMARSVLTAMLAEAGLADRVEVASAGTADWHVGKPMDVRAAALLTAHGYDARHEAQQFQAAWHEKYDAVLAMDSTNQADLAALVRDPAPSDGPGRLLMFRAFDPLAGDDRDVADPYYGGDEGFQEVLRVVRRTGAEIVRQLHARLA